MWFNWNILENKTLRALMVLKVVELVLLKCIASAPCCNESPSCCSGGVWELEWSHGAVRGLCPLEGLPWQKDPWWPRQRPVQNPFMRVTSQVFATSPRLVSPGAHLGARPRVKTNWLRAPSRGPFKSSPKWWHEITPPWPHHQLESAMFYGSKLIASVVQNP